MHSYFEVHGNSLFLNLSHQCTRCQGTAPEVNEDGHNQGWPALSLYLREEIIWLEEVPASLPVSKSHSVQSSTACVGIGIFMKRIFNPCAKHGTK